MSTRFPLATAAQLRPDLSLSENKHLKTRKAALRSAVSNITLNNAEMLKLYPEVVKCLRSSDSGTRRLSLLYLETYVKSRPQHASEVLPHLVRAVSDTEAPPALRGVALRTLSAVPKPAFAQETAKLCLDALHSPDVYLRKTACYAVAKAWHVAPAAVEQSALIPQLNAMLVHETSPIALTAALQALLSITDATPRLQFVVDAAVARRLAHFVAECPEFSQIAIYAALMRVVPQTHAEADALALQLLPGLRHGNAAVAMGCARVLLLLAHYASDEVARNVPPQVLTRLVAQLDKPPEIAYAVLRNVDLLLQTCDESVIAAADLPLKAFFGRASDLPYISATKIDILAQLATPASAAALVRELGEFVAATDAPAVRQRAAHALARLGMRCADVARECAAKLAALPTNADLDVFVPLTDLAKRYPANAPLRAFVRRCVRKRDAPLNSPDARAAYFWAVAQAQTVEDAADAAQLFSHVAAHFLTEKPAVQTQILAAVATLRQQFPTETRFSPLLASLLEIAVQRSVDPDVRDRALFYARLIQRGKQAAEVLNAPVSALETPTSALDANQQEDLELSLGHISSLYLKPAEQLFRQAPVRQLAASPALRPRSASCG